MKEVATFLASNRVKGQSILLQRIAFASKVIMLVEFVQGKPLNHRSKGGKDNEYYDNYYGIGKSFLI